MGAMYVTKCNVCIDGRAPFLFEANWSDPDKPPPFITQPRYDSGNGRYTYASARFIVITPEAWGDERMREGEMFWREVGYMDDLPGSSARQDMNMIVYKRDGTSETPEGYDVWLYRLVENRGTRVNVTV